jgi:hypothetical protein
MTLPSSLAGQSTRSETGIRLLAKEAYRNAVHAVHIVLAFVRRVARSLGRTLHALLIGISLRQLFRWAVWIIVLIYIRVFVLKNIPWLVKHGRLVEIMVNAVLFIIAAIEDVVKVIILAIKEIIDGIKALAGRKSNAPTANWAKLHFVTVAETTARLTAIGRVCGDVNTGPKAAVALARWGLNEPLCPIVRAAWPTNAKGITNAAMGWATYTPDPEQMAHSCQADDDETTLAFCGGLASGFILLELVIPIVLASIILYEFFRVHNPHTP